MKENYNFSTQLILLSEKPMINSYHKMSIYFEMMEWSIDSSLIEFGSVPGASISNVEFESLDFFDEKNMIC